MGMEQTVRFRGGGPTWAEVSQLLERQGFPVQVRMIDGELAFPDEQPPDGWRELRLGTPQGMVTVRRGAEEVQCITWGNADAPLREAWNAVTWGFAAAAGGEITTEGTPRKADEFRAWAEFPAVLGPAGR